MDKVINSVGDRVEKFCEVCGEVRGHVVATVTKRGLISRVTCPQCNTRSPFKSGNATTADGGDRSTAKTGSPYDWSRTYRTGQSMLHPTYGYGEVTAVIEKKIDVLFSDRMRRLVHGRKDI